jgi:glycine cleavage system aminomethyltransferase T
VRTSRDFEELFACFRRHRVRALIVGAHAVAFHAKPRYTKDIDVLVEPTAENAERLLAALGEFGFGGLGLTAADFTRPETVVQLGYPPSRVDLITSIGGVSFGEAWAGKVAGRYGSVEVEFIGRDELIRAKRAANRPQDQADLAWLQADEPEDH